MQGKLGASEEKCKPAVGCSGGPSPLACLKSQPFTCDALLQRETRSSRHAPTHLYHIPLSIPLSEVLNSFQEWLIAICTKGELGCEHLSSPASCAGNLSLQEKRVYILLRGSYNLLFFLIQNLRSLTYCVPRGTSDKAQLFSSA